MINTINDAWGWIGANPSEVVTSNEFGNVIFVDHDESFWRITPEELSCEIIAHSAKEYNQLIKTDDFKVDWFMENLVEAATSKYGTQPADRCFCLKVSAVLGGEYDIENIGTISRTELVSFSGDIAEKIKDVPDGQPIKFDVVD